MPFCTFLRNRTLFFYLVVGKLLDSFFSHELGNCMSISAYTTMGYRVYRNTRFYEKNVYKKMRLKSSKS